MRVLVALGLMLGACSFTPGAFTSDGGGDGPPPITVGFAKAASTADEESADVAIRVVLSAPAEQTITVAYKVSGGSATKTLDYTEADGTLTFAPGDVEEVINVTVLPDNQDEPDETIELQLSSVTGGASLASAMHTMTIAANVLPRASFATPSTTGAEDTSTTVVVTLDKAPLIPTSLDLIVDAGSTASGGGVDYTLSATTVTFAVGETSKSVDLTVNNDALDENDESAIVTMDNLDGTLLASSGTTRTHTITDDDLPPTVSFAAATSSANENAGSVDLTVSLSALSGKDISVAFAAAGGSTATATADYTFGTASPLSFPAGTQTKTIKVNIVQDTTAEAGETVIIALGALTNVSGGATTSHTLTIVDDDSTCLGSGNYAACVATPSATQTLTGTVNTDTDPRCQSPVSGWTGQPTSCFIVGTTIAVSGATNVIGTKPLVLFATGNIGISANLDVASHRGGTNGPSANSALCTAFTDNPSNGNGGKGGGGGAGGTFRTKGGNGGDGDAGGSGGSATTAVGAPTVLRGGCAGQTGANGNASATGGGAAGSGGGALYIVTGGTLTIGSGISVNASGAGGSAAGAYGGGGGAGSGGMIKIDAQAVSVNGAVLIANGGGGARGGDNPDPGADGFDPNPATPTTQAAGGTAGSGGGDGGKGFAGNSQATKGANGGNDSAGGGGGGGGGHIESNQTLTGATVSAG